jgi:hypothetical protein
MVAWLFTISANNLVGMVLRIRVIEMPGFIILTTLLEILFGLGFKTLLGIIEWEIVS